MNFPRLCIPSYNRPDMLKNKTLRFLQKVGYPSEQIYIFVASDDERLRYQTANPGYNLIVGVLGLKQQRQFICDWLDDDEIYIGMDDDVSGIKSIGKSFTNIIRDALEIIESRRTGLYGILPKDDTRCFKDNTTNHLSFVIGCLFICRNHKDIQLHGNCETDDYERCILYYIKYGHIFRYRGAGVSSVYQGTSGGDKKGFIKRKKEAVTYLLKMYPGYCSFRNKKGEPDILLNWRARLDASQIR